MTKYVAGFLFDEDFEHVALILKNKPSWQKDKLNGIGGKIEEGESSMQAIRREFKEETGVDIDQWDLFVSVFGDDYEVDFYWSTGVEINDCKTMTEERVIIENVDVIQHKGTSFELINNLYWLIPLAIDKATGFSGLIITPIPNKFTDPQP